MVGASRSVSSVMWWIRFASGGIGHSGFTNEENVFV